MGAPKNKILDTASYFGFTLSTYSGAKFLILKNPYLLIRIAIAHFHILKARLVITSAEDSCPVSGAHKGVTTLLWIPPEL